MVRSMESLIALVLIGLLVWTVFSRRLDGFWYQNQFNPEPRTTAFWSFSGSSGGGGLSVC